MPDMWIDVDAAVVVPVNILPLIDDTDFKTRETAVAYNAAGMDLVWNFTTSAGATTQTAVTPTTAGVYDWTHLGDGMYTIEIPASGGGSINNDTEGYGFFTGIATGVLPWRSPIYGFRAAGLNDALTDSAYSTTRGLAGTALPNAAAEAAGGLFTRGSGAGQINQDANGRIDVSLKAILGTALTETAGQIAGAFKKLFDVAAPTGTVNSLPTAAPGANGGLATVDGSNRIAGVQGTINTLDDLDTTQDAQHAATQGRLPAALIGGRIDASVGAMATGVLTSTAIAADAITDAKVASDVTISSVTGSVGSVSGNVGGNVVGSVGSVVGAVGSVSGNLGGNVAGSVASVAAAGISAASFAAGAIDATSLDATAVAEIADGVLDEAIAQPSAVFSWSSSLRGIVGFLGALSRNKITQTATVFSLRNAADSADIAAANVSDDATTFVRGEMS